MTRVSTADWMVSTLDLMVNTLERPESTEGMTGSMWGLLESVAHQSQDWQGSTLRRSSEVSQVNEQGSTLDCSQSPMGQGRRLVRSSPRLHLLASRQLGTRVLHHQAKESHPLLPHEGSLPLQTCLLASLASY